MAEKSVGAGGHNLAEILDAFDAPIKFDQAWALVFVYLTDVQGQHFWPLIHSLNQIIIKENSVAVQNDPKTQQSTIQK